MAPAADLSASGKRPGLPASHPAGAAAVWGRRPCLLQRVPQASVVQPVFQAAGCLSVRLPSKLSEGDYPFRQDALTQRRGFNHIDRTSVNAHRVTKDSSTRGGKFGACRVNSAETGRADVETPVII